MLALVGPLARVLVGVPPQLGVGGKGLGAHAALIGLPLKVRLFMGLKIMDQLYFCKFILLTHFFYMFIFPLIVFFLIHSFLYYSKCTDIIINC